MKKLVWLSLAFFFTVLLSGCYGNSYNVQTQPNWVKEDWMRLINTNPRLWTQGADSWFFNGEPDHIETNNVNAPATVAMTRLSVHVPNFTKIISNGSFQVQIVGSVDHNSVGILGPNLGTQQIEVSIEGDTLHVNQREGSQMDLCKVIVRIGVRNLRLLENDGSGTIYGRDIRSDILAVNATNTGNIIIAGHMNLFQVNHAGLGKVIIIGACAPCVDVQILNNGIVGIAGRVGLRNVVNNNHGCLNVIGADSNGLDIMATGDSFTGIIGFVNLKKVIALDNSQVYLYWVRARDTVVDQAQESRVGLAGETNTLHLNITDHARFEGEYLKSQHAYVRANKYAHANVNAKQSIFATAKEHSAVFFFGPPDILPLPDVDRGNIIPMYHNKALFCMPSPKPGSWCRVSN